MSVRANVAVSDGNVLRSEKAVQIRRVMRAVVLCLFAGAAGAWAVWPQPSDRDALDRLVEHARHGFETGSVPEIMGCVGRGYRDGGGLSRSDILRISQKVTRRAKEIKVTINQYQLDLRSPKKATGRFDVEADLDLGGETVNWPMLLDVTFEKQAGGWRGLWRPHWVVVAVNGHGLDKKFEDLF